MTTRRRRGGGTSSGGDGGSGSTPARRPAGGGSGGPAVDPDSLDTMAGRLDATRDRVGAVRTNVAGISVGQQSFGIVGQGFSGPANQHLRTAQQQVQRTQDAIDHAQRGTRGTAQSYRTTEADNVANMNRVQTDANTPRTGPAGTSRQPRQPAQGQPSGSNPPTPSGSNPPNPGNGTGPTSRPPRVRRRPRPDPTRAADAAALRGNRPSLRKKTKFQVYKNAQRSPNGNLICPSTGEEIPVKRDRNGNPILFNERGRRDPNGFTVPQDNPRSGQGDAVYHFGHVPDSEYHRLMKLIEDNPGRWNHQEILDEYNNPGHYAVESPSANVGHSHESTAPGYGHYQHLANTPPPAPTAPPGPGPQQQPPRVRRR